MSSDHITQAAHNTVTYFKSTLQKDGSFGLDATDLACYYKVPMMFAIGGCDEEANRVLNFIMTSFMTEKGDFVTSPGIKSTKPEYQNFWWYPNGWIIRAAIKLKRGDVIEPAFTCLQRYMNSRNVSILTNDAAETDVLSSAHYGLIAKEYYDYKFCMNQENIDTTYLGDAHKMAQFLCDTFEEQKDHLFRGFYLRKSIAGNLIKNNEPIYFIDKKAPEQLYFMMAYPAAFLGLMYLAYDDKAYLKYAKAYADFCLKSHETVYACPFSHKLAWACSVLYMCTFDTKYRDAEGKILKYFVSEQGLDGLWFKGQDIETAYDQSAEIACWAIEVKKGTFLPG